MYGAKRGDTDWRDCFFDVWSLIMDTGIEYYAIEDWPRVIASLSTVTGLLFASVLTGRVVLFQQRGAVGYHVVSRGEM